MVQRGCGQDLAIAPSARSPAGGIASEHITEPGSGGAGVGLEQLPAAAIGGSHDAAGTLEQHAGPTGLGSLLGCFQGREAHPLGKQAGEFAGVGGEPGGPPALL